MCLFIGLASSVFGSGCPQMGQQSGKAVNS